MEFLKYPAGSDEDDTVVLARQEIEPSDADEAFRWDAGLVIGPKSRTKTDGEPDIYELLIGAWEFGVMLGAARSPDIEAVMGGFLRTATPEVLGAVVGRIVSHLAQAAVSRSSQVHPEAGRAEPGGAANGGA